MDNTYRLSKGDPRSGIGSAAGGRWNPNGVQIIFTSIHASLEAFEILTNLADLPRGNNLTEINIPNHIFIEHGPFKTSCFTTGIWSGAAIRA